MGTKSLMLMFGTFSPIHEGHLKAAKEIKARSPECNRTVGGIISRISTAIKKSKESYDINKVRIIEGFRYIDERDIDLFNNLKK